MWWIIASRVAMALGGASLLCGVLFWFLCRRRGWIDEAQRHVEMD